MTIEDILERIKSINAPSDDIWLDKVADILVEIGNESLDKTKPTGQFVGYLGVILEEWTQKESYRPFFRKDSITNKWNPDPRVIFIGQVINEIGGEKEDGLSYMQETYYNVGKKFHGSTRELEYAWKGIGYWQT